jgi:cytochrome c
LRTPVKSIPITSAGVAGAQDVTAGATSYKKCVSCHDVGPTAKNKVGPVLNGIDGQG